MSELLLATPARSCVIVVDDDDALRAALAFALEAEGFAVMGFASGEAVLAGGLPSERACLVIDEVLPGIGGLDLLHALRRRNVGLPALLITTNPKPGLRKAAGAAGVPIVEKPLVGDNLMAAIREALAL